MNPLVCFVAVLGVVSAQSWGGQGHREGGYRAPVVPAPLAHDGRVIDTPEINQAKAAHFAAHEAAQRAAPRQAFNNYQAPRNNYNSRPQQSQEYRAPQEYNRNADYDNYDDGSYRQQEEKEEPRWRGPLAKIEFTADGKFIKDTPEVAHARSAHLAAIQAAQKNGKSVGYEGIPERYGNEAQYDDGSYRGEGEQSNYNNGNNNYQGNGGYQGGNQYNNAVDDGQYRGEGNSQGRNWQGQGQGRQNRYY